MKRIRAARSARQFFDAVDRNGKQPPSPTPSPALLFERLVANQQARQMAANAIEHRTAGVLARVALSEREAMIDRWLDQMLREPTERRQLVELLEAVS